MVNDHYRAYRGYRVTAEVYDLDMRRIDSQSAAVDLPEDGVANDVLTLDFSASKTPVQFIKLRLFDERGKQAGSNFYWRSDNEYKGANTLTGPATAGSSRSANWPGPASPRRTKPRWRTDATTSTSG